LEHNDYAIFKQLSLMGEIDRYFHNIKQLITGRRWLGNWNFGPTLLRNGREVVGGGRGGEGGATVKVGCSEVEDAAELEGDEEVG
jgi:hypothetical protein